MDEVRTAAIVQRRAEIVDRVHAALARSGRPSDAARIVAVSKTVGVEDVAAAYAAGYTCFGENRPQELVAKYDALLERSLVPNVTFEMIGNLQTNKINALLGRVSLIHSVSSAHLAQAISDRQMRHDPTHPISVLLEVNVSGEGSKSGFSPQELRSSFGALMELSGIRMCGLMTMAPRGNTDTARRVFEGLRLLRDDLESAHPDANLFELSCGMSEDFECAIEEGSTIIRLGRVVFDPSFALQ